MQTALLNGLIRGTLRTGANMLNPVTSNRLSGKHRTPKANHSVCKKECEKEALGALVTKEIR